MSGIELAFCAFLLAIVAAFAWPRRRVKDLSEVERDEARRARAVVKDSVNGH